MAPALLAILVFCQGARCQAPSASAHTQSAKPETSIPERESPTPNPDPAARDRWHVLGARPLGLYYYSSDARGLESLEAHASQMTLLAPQCFWVDEQGLVHGELPAQVAEIVQRTNLPVMPLVINPGFDQATARALLRNPRAQERAAMYLAYLANRDNYVGWQLDLEHIDSADRQRYSLFVVKVAARLHRDRRLLSVAVVPRFSDRYPDRSKSEFHTGEWGAPYDYRALGRAADFVSLMAYDHHGDSDSPGPVAGFAWVEAAVRYAVARVPSSKLLLGIPFYGREWVSPEAGGQTAKSRSLSYQDAQDVLERPGMEPRWDERWRTGWFEYVDDSGKHIGWYEDSKSLTEKLMVMRKYQLRGFAAWRLGFEDPAFWTLELPAPPAAPPKAHPRRGTMPAPTARPVNPRPTAQRTAHGHAAKNPPPQEKSSPRRVQRGEAALHR